MTDIDSIWAAITRLAGTEFHTKTGKAFFYDIVGNGVALRNTNRSLPRSHFERAMSRAPLTGPGQLQDLQGPSYIFAILTDSRVRSGVLSPASTVVSCSAPEELSAPLSEKQPVPAVPPSSGTLRRYGTAVSFAELSELGFSPFQLRFHEVLVPTARGVGSNWDTIGEVPEGPGLYAFTTEDPGTPDSMHVVYVGLTSNLWMVTKGQLPGGDGRGGQRYGRPKHAGETRKRVNTEITRARLDGLEVVHWLKPMVVPVSKSFTEHLRQGEERLIQRWSLRSAGWNRG